MALVPVTPPTTTVMGPELAPLGTGTTICVAVDDVAVAAVPLNLMVLAEAVALKWVPVSVTT